MNKKIIFSVVFSLILILPFIIIPLNAFWDFGPGYLGFMKPFVRDYHLTSASSNIVLKLDGSMDVKEKINYDFKGCYHEVYRTLKIPSNEGHPNAYSEPTLSFANGYCNPNCEFINRGYELAGNFGTICDKEVSFNLDYRVEKALTEGDDVVIFHYKLWGTQWDKPLLNGFKGEIQLPKTFEKKDIDVYFNPAGIVKNYVINGDKLIFKTPKFFNFLEVKLVMPKEGFLDTSKFPKDYTSSRSSIKKEQEDYLIKFEDVKKRNNYLLLFLICLMIVWPLFLYYKFGREPKISYNGLYEREPVKGYKPYFINWLASKESGAVDENLVPGMLLDLIRRKHIKAELTKSKPRFSFTKKLVNDTKLTILGNPDDSLTKPEQIVFDFFKEVSTNNVIFWNKLLSDLRINQLIGMKFGIMFKKLKKAIREEIDEKKFFISTGNTLSKVTSFFSIIIVAFLFCLSMSGNNLFYPNRLLTLYVFIFFIYNIVSLSINSRVFGRFTPLGYEIYKKSKNFEKFMLDLTLLKKYPPASIIIWEEQLVYAAIFGVAEEVVKNWDVIPSTANYSSRSSLRAFSTGATIGSLSSFRAAISRSSSSGGGGVGGGFGGGGGGAR